MIAVFLSVQGVRLGDVGFPPPVEWPWPRVRQTAAHLTAAMPPARFYRRLSAPSGGLVFYAELEPADADR
jgi:hypothetical protein